MSGLNSRVAKVDAVIRTLTKRKAALPAELASLPMGSLSEVRASLALVMGAVLRGDVSPTVGNTFAALAGRLVDAWQHAELERIAQKIEEHKRLIEIIKAQRAANGAAPPLPNKVESPTEKFPASRLGDPDRPET